METEVSGNQSYDTDHKHWIYKLCDRDEWKLRQVEINHITEMNTDHKHWIYKLCDRDEWKLRQNTQNG
jgi:hypothetical protein